jgi:hypothetical protein
MNSPVLVCETGTPLIRATRWSIQGQTRRFCRVSYIGLMAATRKRRDKRSVPSSQNDSASFQSRPPKIRRSHE